MVLGGKIYNASHQPHTMCVYVYVMCAIFRNVR